MTLFAEWYILTNSIIVNTWSVFLIFHSVNSLVIDLLLMLLLRGMLFLVRFMYPLLLSLSERSLNPISTPRHTHLSLNLWLFSMVLDPFVFLDNDIGRPFWCDFAPLSHLVKDRLSAIKVQSKLELDICCNPTFVLYWTKCPKVPLLEQVKGTTVAEW